MRRITAALGALVILSSGLVAARSASPATAADGSPSTCRDAGGTPWTSQVTWGSPYRDAGGVTRVQVDYAGWTTSRAGKVPTDSAVRTYSPTGALVQTLGRTTAFDYHSGSVWAARNPVDPPSAPGRTKVTVTTGVDGDGFDNCTVTSLQPATAAPSATTVTKVLTVVEENHSIAQMKSGMPYLYSLAKRYAYASDYAAIRHPSLPNYLAIAGGSTFGVTDDTYPSAHPLAAKTVFGQAKDRGLRAATYAQSMTSKCQLTGNVDRGYAVRHNPWTYFTPERSLCRSYDVPETAFRQAATENRLPNVGLLVPDKCHDAHDCDLATADGWLRSRLPSVLASKDFTSGRLVVVVTADEDDHHDGNRVLTVVLQAGLDGKHEVVSTPLTHYSLSRLYSQTVGATPLRNAANAPDMARAFGLHVG